MAQTASREEVELRAYEIYVERGGEDGHDVEDWIAAERELASEPERGATTATRPSPQTTLRRSATAGSGDRS